MKTCILGMISFPKDHTTTNISVNLINLHLEFGLYPKSSDGRTAQCRDAVRLGKLQRCLKGRPTMIAPHL